MDSDSGNASLSFEEKLRLWFYNHNIKSVDPPLFIKNRISKESRKIYVNLDLPQELINPKTNTPLATYPRNKIRTTKYTPLTFIPKNLFNQFTNIANSYFLFLVILGAFQIFGVSDPGLSAVPLIVIVVITAVRDAFEDYKRGASDANLNNCSIHLLCGLINNNVIIDHVGPWRRFKKSCSKLLRKNAEIIKKIKKEENNNLKNPKKSIDSNNNELNRASTDFKFSLDTNRSNRKSLQFLPETIKNPDFEASSNVKFSNKRWKDIYVGDFVRIRNNEEVPADIVIISTSDSENGTCFVETKNLDGESNLKVRNALGAGEGIKHSTDLASAQFMIECEPPNVNLYSFKGVLHYKDYMNEEKKELTEPITNDNVLLRGCSLRNTKWVIGIVIYTGPETKIMLNSGITPTKFSKISRELNLSVIINFIFLFVICFVSGVVNGVFYDKKNDSRIYFEYKAYGPNPPANGVIAFFVSVILYQSLVPISLYISIEIIKTIQAFFIYSDVNMYYEKLDYPCTPKSWNISDDLGQIEYIFSDKTGTLTQNVMEFKHCTVGGKSYGVSYTEARMGMNKRKGIDVIKEAIEIGAKINNDKSQMCNLINENLTVEDQFDDKDLTFISPEYVEEMLSNTEQGSKNGFFMFCLAVCHTVITERNKDGKILFQAESPDESALVKVARDLGYLFVERTRNGFILQKFNGTPQEIKVLNIIPFNSTRKRMSVIIEINENDSKKIFMITKGADNVIYERLSPNQDQEVISKTALHLEEFAKEGLRTLCIASKEITNISYFNDWLKRYHDAKSSIDENREELIDRISEELESDLILLGGTAIEDKLQEMVPESINILSKAGIKLWVLTGDKVETAINIGFSCNLLTNDMKLLVISKSGDDSADVNPDEYDVATLITKYLEQEFNMEGSAEELEIAIKNHDSPTIPYALIVDGDALTTIFHEDNSELARKFLLLGKHCKSVLCCRVSPSQKASVVKLVRKNLKVMTLAIGDGANDVAMIQAANVGVGIAGEEGRQAAMSSDYAIGQFRFLTRLVLVHGRWSYKRLAEMIPCFFYKNVIFTMTLFWYGIFNNFDGSYLYEYTFLMFYNLAFTSLPVIFLGFLDQDVSDTVSLLVPELYKSGVLGLEWSQYKFIYYMLDGLYQSAIAFFFVYCVYHRGNFLNDNGLAVDHRFWMGVMVSHISVISCNLYVLLQQYNWDYITLLINAFSNLIIFFWSGVWSSSLASQEFYKAASQMFGTLGFWCCFFVGVVSCLLPRFIYDNISRYWYPKDIDIVRERVILGDFQKYPSGYDPTNLAAVEKLRNSIYTGTSDNFFETKDSSSKDEESQVEILGDTEEKHLKFPEKSAVISRFKSISKSLKKPPNFDSENISSKDLQSIRLSMVARGELSTTSLERIQTTHELPGLTQADSLLERYSTRGTTGNNT
ncbi:hypothetical protein PACTADRAFT_43115 [Pachysolen tannophilus NRRL Y-2460]|uniref:Phospholipid-transporting ATPase n=1 Tax=Pachysolen tannophilus NRRL Y-2460 TaxID=669874 RepID=A0A1E4TV66_PACTA|nr:hypothetical protein PACTADRAFT_43115 [Pachysolen tannophilus NRRL Y-2460]